ncbi:MAG: hypothetical protein QM529_04085 [Hydrotalea sp.]|nr:hypothetical protein [Hydrotalea sp.]
MKNINTANKTPEITIYFWLFNLLLTMVGGSALDFLNTYVGLGLGTSMVAVFVLLVGALYLQFKTRQYNHWVYWSVVLLIGAFAMAVVDTLTTNYAVPLNETCQVAGISLLVLLGAWFSIERTLSIHSITTCRREVFYWATVLLVFATGTAFDEWLLEHFGVSYISSVVFFAVLIMVIAICHYVVAWCLSATGRYHPAQHVMAFWLAYILIRPLAQALSDYLSQDADNGGLGIDDGITSPLAIIVVVALLAYLQKTKKDVIKKPA